MRTFAVVGDGTRIAVQMTRGADYDIGIVTVEGRRRIDVATGPAYDGSFTWAPDGRSIAFISGRNGAEALHVVSVDGRETRRLTATPAWSR